MRGSLSARPIPLDKLTIKRLSEILSNTIRVNNCWLYTNPHHTGYSYASIDGIKYPVHRVVKAISIGADFPGKVADHLCRNRSCVNPKHLEVVTASENVRRGLAWTFLPNQNRALCNKGHSLENSHISIRKEGGIKRSCRECHAINERNRRLRQKVNHA